MLPAALPWISRRVLVLTERGDFSRALGEGKLPNAELRELSSAGVLRGLESCADDAGVLQSGGAVLCLAAAAGSEGARRLHCGDAVGGSVACVLSPAGLTVWAPKEEVKGILELLELDAPPAGGGAGGGV